MILTVYYKFKLLQLNKGWHFDLGLDVSMLKLNNKLSKLYKLSNMISQSIMLRSLI